MLQVPGYDAQEIVDGYMVRACARFEDVCKYDLTDRNDDTREFNMDVPDNEIDDIVDIVSEGMVIQWLKPYMFSAELYRNTLNTADFTSYSPAELLYRVKDAYTTAKKDFTAMVRNYSYVYGDLTNLWM